MIDNRVHPPSATHVRLQPEAFGPESASLPSSTRSRPELLTCESRLVAAHLCGLVPTEQIPYTRERIAETATNVVRFKAMPPWPELQRSRVKRSFARREIVANAGAGEVEFGAPSSDSAGPGQLQRCEVDS